MPLPTDDPRYDEWLALGCQLGERAAFDALIARWHGPLHGYARRLCGDDDGADEIVQDTWLRVLRGIAGLRDPARLRPWLFGIARRAGMDRLRGRYAEPAAEADLDPDTLALDAAEPERALDLLLLQRHIDRLPPPERETLSLHYLQGLSLEEIANVIERPLGTVKSRLFRARALLRRHFDRQGEPR